MVSGLARRGCDGLWVLRGLYGEEGDVGCIFFSLFMTRMGLQLSCLGKMKG